MTSTDNIGIEYPVSVIVAAIAFGIAAYMLIGIEPMLLGGLAEAGRLTNPAIGRIATGEFLFFALGTAGGPALLQRGPFRKKVIGIAVLLIILDMTCCLATSEGPLLVLRACSGLMEGGLLAAAILILTYARNPQRLSGYFLSFTVIPQIAALYILPRTIPVYGVNIGFAWLAITAAFAALAALSLPEKFPLQRENSNGQKHSWTPMSILALATILLQFAAIGGGWSYIPKFANEAGIAGNVVGLGLSLTAIFGATGNFMIASFGWRLDYRAVLIVGSLAQAADALFLIHFRAPTTFIIGCCIYGVLWNCLIPFSLKLLIQLDPSRRTALLQQPVALAGLGIGPFISSLTVTATDVTPAFWWSAGLFAISWVLFLTLSLISLRTERTAAA